MFMHEEETKPELVKFREKLEEVFVVPQDQAALFLSKLQAAIRHLQELLSPEGIHKPQSWADSWFEDIGVDKRGNVYACKLVFTKFWLEFINNIAHLIRNIQPHLKHDERKKNNLNEHLDPPKSVNLSIDDTVRNERNGRSRQTSQKKWRFEPATRRLTNLETGDIYMPPALEVVEGAVPGYSVPSRGIWVRKIDAEVR